MPVIAAATVTPAVRTNWMQKLWKVLDEDETPHLDRTVNASVCVSKTTITVSSLTYRGKLTLNTKISELDFGQMMLPLKYAEIINP